jgi:hypothetical protein
MPSKSPKSIMDKTLTNENEPFNSTQYNPIKLNKWKNEMTRYEIKQNETE